MKSCIRCGKKFKTETILDVQNTVHETIICYDCKRIDLKNAENRKRFNKIRNKFKINRISKETVFEIMQGKRCKKCLGRIIADSDRYGLDSCSCNKAKRKNSAIAL